MPKHYDIAIVGQGISGLSLAYHLQKNSKHSILLIHDHWHEASSISSASALSGGQFDNFTRVSQAHGFDFAKDFWRFGDMAFDECLAFVRQHHVPVHQYRRRRYVVSEHELKECEKAVDQLRKANLAGQLLPPVPSTSSILAIQDEGQRGASVDARALLQALEAKVNCDRMLGSLLEYKHQEAGLKLSFKDGRQVNCEILVLACHLGVGELIPSLSSALVSYADQWSRFAWPKEVRGSSVLQTGEVFSLNHTYEWGVVEEQSLIFGGGRYLRPLAGIGATGARVEPHIIEHLKKCLAKYFHLDLPLVSSSAGLEIRPCDELPVIGPMYGEDRLFVSTGYMGLGLSMGFFSGKCLAELILKGSSPQLLRRLWPERLRSLQ